MSVSQSIGRTTSFLVYQRPYLRISTATSDLGLLGRLEPAHPLGGDGFEFAFELDMLERSCRFIEEPSETFRDEYLAAACVRLQPRCRVHHVADCREVTDCGVPADVADERFAVIEADAEVQRGAVTAAIAETREQPAGVVQHDVRYRSPVRIVGRPRGARDEDGQIQGHDLVADQLVDERFREEHVLGDGIQAS